MAAAQHLLLPEVPNLANLFFLFVFSRLEECEIGPDLVVDENASLELVEDAGSELIDRCFQRWTNFHAWLQQTSHHQTFIEWLAAQGDDHLSSYTVLADFFGCKHHSTYDPEAKIREVFGTGPIVALGYTNGVAWLFLQELLWRNSEDTFDEEPWSEIRKIARKVALAQEVTHSILVSYESMLANVIPCLSHVRNQSTLPRTVVKVGSMRLPYYLWDISRACTVVVTELPEIPAYTCISHTWGR